FRLRTGTRRSLHPTHSVCATGQLADELLQEHRLDETPCGPHSPFHRLPEVDGQILLLGCGLAANTSMHAVEERVEPPYLLHPAIVYQLTGGDGRSYRRAYRRHNFRGWEQRYERIAGLLKAPDLIVGQVLAAECHLVAGRAFQKAALAALQRDPFYFVAAAAQGAENED
ncbi:MAG: AAC(3) family N-acetyltransferase, partial [Anaerolineales bacterium]|nr:AAC(3) family N-acetyltransferase [Anaerolineales bacterium]